MLQIARHKQGNDKEDRNELAKKRVSHGGKECGHSDQPVPQHARDDDAEPGSGGAFFHIGHLLGYDGSQRLMHIAGISLSKGEHLPDDQRASLLSQIPLGRLGDVSEIAHAVVFLASRQAGYITGETLHVNGGMLMD